AEAFVEQAKERVEWSERMLRKGYVSQQQVEAARANLRIAEATLATAKQNRGDASPEPQPPKSSKLRELENERLATLKEIADQMDRAYRSGQASLEQLQQAKQSVLRAQLDLCKSDKERIPVLEELVGIAKRLEELVTVQVRKGVASSSERLRA